MTTTQVPALTQSTLSPAQLEIRRTGIGASEIAAVLGLHHKITPLDIWLQKRGMAEPFADNQYLRMGRVLEGVIRGLYFEDVARPEGLAMMENVGTMVHTTEQWMLATPDAVLVRPDADEERWVHGLECKNRDAMWRDAWGESGSEHFPDDVAMQCLWSMAVTGLQRWDIAVLLGGNDFRTYTMHFDAELLATVMEMARTFWFENVVGGKEPPLVGRSAKDYLKRKYTMHSAELVDATPEVAEYMRQYAQAKLRLKDCLDEVNSLETILCNEIGHNAGLKSRHGTFTWKQTKESFVKAHTRPATRRIHWSPAKV